MSNYLTLINYSFHKISIWQKKIDKNHQNYQIENQYHLCHFRIKVEKFYKVPTQWLQNALMHSGLRLGKNCKLRIVLLTSFAYHFLKKKAFKLKNFLVVVQILHYALVYLLYLFFTLFIFIPMCYKEEEIFN